MANIIFDFLTDSFLFDERYMENLFEDISEKELFSELQKYREYVQTNCKIIEGEIQTHSKLNVVIESIGKLPSIDILKQLTLYMDKIVLPDPIFELTAPKSNMQEPFSQLMGLNPSEQINRQQLYKSVCYMKNTTSLVSFGIVKYVPISLIHEPPQELPILYSEDNFSSVLSKELYTFFYDRAQIKNVIREQGTMTFDINKELSKGTTIAINFDGFQNEGTYIYQYVSTKILNIDEKTRKFESFNYIPDTISDDEFTNWINHSINRAAINKFTETLNEAILAQKLNCMYMAKTQFTADLLSQTMAKRSVDADLANLSMKLELPILNEISIDDLVGIRMNSGEAFYNFRNDLNAKLLSLRDFSNKEDLQTRLENISYELNQTQVHNVKKEYRKILKSLGVDATLLLGSLITSCFTGGLTLIGAAGAVAKGSRDYIKYLHNVKEDNGYFLWKLNK